VMAWMLGGSVLSIFALAISLAGLLLAFPSVGRWQKLCGNHAAADHAETVAGAPRPHVSRPAPPGLLGLLILLIVCAGALAAIGVAMVWAVGCKGEPVRPFIHVLEPLLACAMLGLAALRWMRAPTSRHPRWQRAHSVLLVLARGLNSAVDTTGDQRASQRDIAAGTVSEHACQSSAYAFGLWRGRLRLLARGSSCSRSRRS
jgi:hypothetical protein